jgi:hypothetical protein
VDEYGARDAAPLASGDSVAQGHVVGDNDNPRRDSLGARKLGREAEIEPVPGVVLDDQHGAARARRMADSGQHRIDAGRGEDIAHDRRCQHALPDIAAMGGFVPAAAAGEDRDGPFGGLWQIGPEDDILLGKKRQARMQIGQPLQHLADDVTRIVDQLLHGLALATRACR